jgi:hypothetical protein
LRRGDGTRLPGFTDKRSRIVALIGGCYGLTSLWGHRLFGTRNDDETCATSGANYLEDGGGRDAVDGSRNNETMGGSVNDVFTDALGAEEIPIAALKGIPCCIPFRATIRPTLTP